MNVVPIKVKIGKKPDGTCLYPDFNQLACVQASGADWSHYIDTYGQGWQYDGKCGHDEIDAESPEGVWYGLILIPAIFATEATAMFPAEVSVLTEAQCESFYNGRHAVYFPDEEIDITILEGIKIKQDLGLALTPNQTKALDPDDDMPGIRKNKKKTWTDFKALRNLTVKP